MHFPVERELRSELDDIKRVLVPIAVENVQPDITVDALYFKAVKNLSG